MRKEKMDSIKLINDYTQAVKAIDLIKKNSAEIHRQDLEQIGEFYGSIFNAYDKVEVTKAILLEYALADLKLKGIIK